MKNKKLSAIVLVSASAVVSIAHAQTDRHASLGVHAISGSDTEASAVTPGVEFQINEAMGLSVRAVSFEYETDTGDEFEDGEGLGVEVGLMFYPGARNNFFAGVGLGLGRTEWDYVEFGQFGEPLYVEQDDTIDYEVFGRTGYRFDLGGFHITPQIQLGTWVNTGNEFGAFVIPGVAVGTRF